MCRPKGLFALSSDSLAMIYGPEQREALAARVDFVAPPQTRDSLVADPAVLREVEVIFSGWGGPRLDAEFLAHAPALKAVFYGAGGTNWMITKDSIRRGVLVTTAYAANSVPVAEYALANILLGLKHFWRYAHQIKQTRQYPTERPVLGAYNTTVGLVSLGMIGRTLLKLLTNFDLRVLVYDPFLSEAEARRLNVTLVSLPELFRQSDVVSVHTPVLPETVGLITGEHLASLKHGATFINTARGIIVRENEMIAIAAARPDLQFVLDVVEPEPPVVTSPLFDLPNVILTPHIAGSLDRECQRMGQLMVEEFDRYAAGEPLRYLVTPALMQHSIHANPEALQAVGA